MIGFWKHLNRDLHETRAEHLSSIRKMITCASSSSRLFSSPRALLETWSSLWFSRCSCISTRRSFHTHTQRKRLVIRDCTKFVSIRPELVQPFSGFRTGNVTSNKSPLCFVGAIHTSRDGCTSWGVDDDEKVLAMKNWSLFRKWIFSLHVRETGPSRCRIGNRLLRQWTRAVWKVSSRWRLVCCVSKGASCCQSTQKGVLSWTFVQFVRHRCCLLSGWLLLESLEMSLG